MCDYTIQVELLCEMLCEALGMFTIGGWINLLFDLKRASTEEYI